MPALRWSHRQVIDPDHVYIVMASRLPLKAHRFIPGFLVDTLRIHRQLAQGTDSHRRIIIQRLRSRMGEWASLQGETNLCTQCFVTCSKRR